ncbi:unnamed protein product [Macrosiphum euphorbiae]|uniref:Uncharacterized protein n=1 Tax=Macrosiphum euphorbiae TaxID=13131 RepID=A0AAV0WRM7_9HEMI|nr:unnamed protein product [Macrosiphum euphorbiae]
MSELLCGPDLYDLPTNEAEKAMALIDVEESMLKIILPHNRGNNIFGTGRRVTEKAPRKTYFQYWTDQMSEVP